MNLLGFLPKRTKTACGRQAVFIAQIEMEIYEIETYCLHKVDGLATIEIPIKRGFATLRARLMTAVKQVVARYPVVYAIVRMSINYNTLIFAVNSILWPN